MGVVAAALAFAPVACVGSESQSGAVDGGGTDGGTGMDGTTPEGSSGGIDVLQMPEAQGGGDSSTSEAATPVEGGSKGDGATEAGLAPLSIVPTVGVGFDFGCSGRANGHVYCWGSNEHGQFGNLATSTTATATPSLVANISSAARVAVGRASACALLTDHTVTCWGDNSEGQLGNPAIPTATDAGTGAYSSTPQAVPNLSDVVDLAVGDQFACARKADKSVWCWGCNANDQLGYANTADTVCGGTLVCNPKPTQVTNVTADAIAVGTFHACALVGSSVSCWGDNSNAQLGHLQNTMGDIASGNGYVNPQPTAASATGAAALFAGGENTCILDGTDSAGCWGNDQSGQLGDRAAVLRSSGLMQVAGLAKSATTIGVGWLNSCAVMGPLGGVWCWGEDSYGSDGTPYAAGSPPAAASVTALQSMTFVGIATSSISGSICAIDDAAEVYCWGNNIGDVLGNTNTTGGGCSGSPCDGTPVKVMGLP